MRAIWFYLMMTKRIFLALIVITSILLPSSFAFGQSGSDLPTYIIQPGDTINTIALRFGISPQDIIDTNQISDPNILASGMALKIPGLTGVTGTLTTDIAPIGSTLTSLSRKYQVSEDTLVKLNQLSSPTLIYIGSTLILPVNEDVPLLNPEAQMKPGQSSLEYAAAASTNPWIVSYLNQKTNPTALIPMEPLFGQSDNGESSLASVPDVKTIEISPLPLVQGKTEVIRITTSRPLEISGALAGSSLNFTQEEENVYVALQGIYALAPTGLSTIRITTQDENSQTYSFEQSIILEPGYYPEESISVDPATLDPANTKPEDDLVQSVVTKFSPEKYWGGIFRVPVDEPVCIYSWFGTRRSYNEGPYNYFHAGVDYGVCANLNIYAPAAGKVVFAQETTVRGNATIIDHGQGIFSGIWHQSKLLVKEGDMVEAGQLIGEIGATGRVTGPHLHWEVWVNGIQVDPLDWLKTKYP